MKLKVLYLIPGFAFFVLLGCENKSIYLHRNYPLSTYSSKVKGAWYGQMIGATLGEPFSLRWQNKIIPFAINDYLRIRPEAAKQMNRLLKRTGGRNWTNLQHEFIDNLENWEVYKPLTVPDNSSLFLEMMYLYSFESHSTDSLNGRKFAEDWLKYLKYERIWHASRNAYLNFKNNIWPPESGSVKNNLHSKDVDFLNSADLVGLACPGMPLTSNDWCSRIGGLMCESDGIYAGMFLAGMYSISFFESQIDSIIALGLQCIPDSSELSEAITDVVVLKKQYDNWQDSWKIITEKWGSRDECIQGKDRPLNVGVKLNMAYIVLALLYGNGDFNATMEIAVRCGQHCDGNASCAAGILGCILGENGIPQKWLKPMQRVMMNYSIQEIYPDEVKIDDIIDRNVQIGMKILDSRGGKMFRRFGTEFLIIPFETPKFVR